MPTGRRLDGADSDPLPGPSVVPPQRTFACSSLDQAVRAWIPSALRLATRLTGSPQDGEDLVQTALLKASKAADGFRGDAHAATWLFRILINTWRDRPRLRLTAELDVETVHPAPPPPAIAAGRELETRVNREIARLPERQREALLLFREGMPTAEIASAMDATDANIRKLIQLARDRLRERLADVLEGPR